ncbi:hypothetical protein LEMLEM_LOCUS16798, partial [Lemmus lemmus]
ACVAQEQFLWRTRKVFIPNPGTIKPEEEKKKPKSKRRGNLQAAKHHNYVCRKVKARAKKNIKLYTQGICKEVEEARQHNKAHLVYEAIRQIAARPAPQIWMIKDRQGHLLTKP